MEAMVKLFLVFDGFRVGDSAVDLLPDYRNTNPVLIAIARTMISELTEEFKLVH